jgi:hypothetical protein
MGSIRLAVLPRLLLARPHPQPCGLASVHSDRFSDRSVPGDVLHLLLDSPASGRPSCCLGGMLAIGVGFAPFNGGASTFFHLRRLHVAVRHREGDPRSSLSRSWSSPSPSIEWRRGASLRMVPLLCLRSRIGRVLQQHVLRAKEPRDEETPPGARRESSIWRKVAERERIARDLHDVLGHTLSIIILKSELAGKLIDRDPARAKAEMADVEQTSRAALADVRSTIRGYRSHSLEAEIKQAKSVLETAGVSVQAESVQLPLSPAQESVVALMLREAVHECCAPCGRAQLPTATGPNRRHLPAGDCG